MSSVKRDVQMLDTTIEQLADILSYTEREWGEEQREAYSSHLWEIIDSLASTPDIGRKRDELSAGMRSFPIGSHVIYYWYREDAIFIARILHKRRDPSHEDW